MLTLHHKIHKHLAYSTVFYFIFLFFDAGGGVVEAHQGASWGGERTTVPPPRLQQGFHDRSLPAAPREAHPHRWGRPLLQHPSVTSVCHFHPLNSTLSVTSVNLSMSWKLQFVRFQRRGITFVTSVAKPLNRGNTSRFTRWDIQGPSRCSKY